MELRLISTTYEGKERITREQTIPFCDDGGREEQLINQLRSWDTRPTRERSSGAL